MGKQIDPIILKMCGRRRIPDEPIYIVEDMILISTPHHLHENLERTPKALAIEHEFYEFAEKEENKYEPWVNVIDRFVESKEEFKLIESFYTYNFTNYLDQEIDCVLFRYDHDTYAIIRVHRGMDARVGFSEPRVFKVYDESYFLDFMVQLYCDNCDCDLDEDDVRIVPEQQKVFCKECGEEVYPYASALGW